MTLEETTQAVLAAAEAQDLKSLQAACQLREEAMAALAQLEPTPALRDHVAESIAAGEKAKRALVAIKQRIRGESRRLANIEAGFVRVHQPLERPRINYKG